MLNHYVCNWCNCPRLQLYQSCASMVINITIFHNAKTNALFDCIAHFSAVCICSMTYCFVSNTWSSHLHVFLCSHLTASMTTATQLFSETEMCNVEYMNMSCKCIQWLWGNKCKNLLLALPQWFIITILFLFSVLQWLVKRWFSLAVSMCVHNNQVIYLTEIIEISVVNARDKWR